MTTKDYILYALGKWFEEANKHIKNKRLAVSINKVTFIDLVTRAGIVTKGGRAIYRNLEVLEKAKLVSYAHKELALTSKGTRLYLRIEKEISPYVILNTVLKKKNPALYTKKIQTVFK
jgi:hypothetical protein